MSFALTFLIVVFISGVLLMSSHHMKQSKKRKKHTNALRVIDSFYEQEDEKPKHITKQCNSEILTSFSRGILSDPSFGDGLSSLDSGLVQPYHHTGTDVESSSNSGDTSSGGSSGD